MMSTFDVVTLIVALITLWVVPETWWLALLTLVLTLIG
jgi:hypothetical protein